MAETGLSGPFALTEAEVNQQVDRKSAGTYALDQAHDSGAFRISYVGRSDTDVNERLRQHVGKYRRFKYEYYASPEEAFAKECGLYHDFNPPSTIQHPPRPLGSKWKCPHCKLYG